MLQSNAKKERELTSPITAPHEWVIAAQSCTSLCDSMDCSLPGSFVHGILQASILEWDAISFSNNCISGKGKVNVQTLRGNQLGNLEKYQQSPCNWSRLINSKIELLGGGVGGVVYCHRVENMYDLRDGYDYIFFLSE